MVNAQICFINIDFFEYSGIGGGKFRFTDEFFLKPVLSLARHSDVLFSDRYLGLCAATPIYNSILVTWFSLHYSYIIYILPELN